MNSLVFLEAQLIDINKNHQPWEAQLKISQYPIVKKISCTLDKHTMESNRHLQVGFVHD